MARWLRDTIALLLLLALSTASVADQFSEVHVRAGLAWSASDVVPEIMTAAWADVNGDGRLDLWISPHSLNLFESHTAPIVYVNQGDGAFKRADAGAMFPHGYGQVDDLHQASFGDYNNDGLPDLFLNAGGLMGSGEETGRSLLRNDRTHFTPIAEEMHLSPLVGSGRGALWLDANGDGKLDLIAINAIVNAKTGVHASQLFEQTAGGFLDRTKLTGFRMRVSANFGVLSHLFGDRIPSILLLGGEEKVGPLMYHGLLAGIFRLTPPTLDDITASFPEMPYGRDVAIADFTNDLVPDLFIVNNTFPLTQFPNWASVPPEDRARNGRLPTLLAYDAATRRYADHTARAGFVESIFGSSVLAGDFDNDGFVDLWVFQQYGTLILPAIFYRNSGHGTFVAVPAANGAAYEIRTEVADPYDQQRGIAAAVADYDGDGFLDIYSGPIACASIWNLAASGLLSEKNPSTNLAVPPQLFHNHGNANHWIELDLVGTKSARDAVGATVVVTAGGRQQFREQSSGNHRTGQDMKRLHFGLGASATVDRVVIRWPSGAVQSLGPLQADQILRVEELASDEHR